MSCTREDSARAEPIYKALKSAGFRPWLDIQDLLPGEEWESTIKNTIQKADFFMPFISKTSVLKEGYVQRELHIAFEHMEFTKLMRPEGVECPEFEQYIIPVRLDAVTPPERLRRYQWIDMFSPEGIDKLIFALRTALKVRESKK